MAEPDVRDEPRTGPRRRRAWSTCCWTGWRGADPPARQVWLPPLAESPSLDSLLPSVVPDPSRGMTVGRPAMRGRLRVPVGVVDRPFEQAARAADRRPVRRGRPRRHRRRTAERQVHPAALADPGAGADPHAGGGPVLLPRLRRRRHHVARRPAARRLDRHPDGARPGACVPSQEIRQILERREQLFAAARPRLDVRLPGAPRAAGEIDDPHGARVPGRRRLVHDEAGLRATWSPAFGELAARGLSFGIHVIVTATRWSEMRTWLRDLLGTKFELRLGDTMDSEVGSRKAATVPHQPGRGLTADGDCTSSARCPAWTARAYRRYLAEATKSAVEEIGTFWPGAPAPAVRLLPARLPIDGPAGRRSRTLCGLPRAGRAAAGAGVARLQRHPAPAGVRRQRDRQDQPAASDPAGDRAPVHPRAGPGRARRLPARSATTRARGVPGRARVDHRRRCTQLAEQCGRVRAAAGTGPDITLGAAAPPRLVDGPELFVVVDDYDLLSRGLGQGSTLDPLLPLLAQGVAHRTAPDHRPQHLRRDAVDDGPGPAAPVGARHAGAALLLPQGGGQVPRRGAATHDARRPRPAGDPAQRPASSDRSGGAFIVNTSRPVAVYMTSFPHPSCPAGAS